MPITEVFALTTVGDFQVMTLPSNSS